jgi:replication factor C subunit 3/5
MNKYVPWVEKYRPIDFNNIVLDDNNKILLNNIIEKNYFPNLLLYGPPGTGKTTTIINLIQLYQQTTNETNNGLMIHLNASDDRGIDIIRNQINNFVNSKLLFNKGMKFIILDEVDYITKNAQIALKNLLQEYYDNTRFCLICNYISKIDETLQSHFVRLRFNNLPKNNILTFLNKINMKENLLLSNTDIESIQLLFGSDIRSMINYMQSNQLAIKNTKIINNSIYDTIHNLIYNNNNENIFINELYNLSILYNIDQKNLIKNYFNYIINNKSNIINIKLLNIISYIIHNSETNIENQLLYIYYSFKSIIISEL